MSSRAITSLYLAIPAVALWAGWAWTSPADAAGQGSPSLSPRHRAESAGTAAQGKPWTADDLLAALRKTTPKIGEFPPDPLLAILATWTDAEILAALDESITRPHHLLQVDEQMSLTHVLFRELIRRDFDASLAWYGNLQSETRNNLAWVLAFSWPAGRPAEGLDFLRRHRGTVADMGSHIIDLNLSAAATRGVAELTALMRSLKEEGFRVGFGSILIGGIGVQEGVKFPPGFDFGALLSSGEVGFNPRGSQIDTSAIFSTWMQRDRDAVWQWLLDHHGGASLNYATRDFFRMTPEDHRWFAGKMAALQPAQRMDLLREKLSGWITAPGYARDLIAASADTPLLQQEILGYAMQGTFRRQYGDTLPLLEQLPDPEQRLRFLETLEEMEDKGTRYEDPDAVYSDESFRIKLKSWGADDARAAAIARRFRGKEGDK